MDKSNTRGAEGCTKSAHCLDSQLIASHAMKSGRVFILVRRICTEAVEEQTDMMMRQMAQEPPDFDHAVLSRSVTKNTEIVGSESNDVPDQTGQLSATLTKDRGGLIVVATESIRLTDHGEPF